MPKVHGSIFSWLSEDEDLKILVITLFKPLCSDCLLLKLKPFARSAAHIHGLVWKFSCIMPLINYVLLSSVAMISMCGSPLDLVVYF